MTQGWMTIGAAIDQLNREGLAVHMPRFESFVQSLRKRSFDVRRLPMGGRKPVECIRRTAFAKLLQRLRAKSVERALEGKEDAPPQTWHNGANAMFQGMAADNQSLKPGWYDFVVCEDGNLKIVK